MSKRLIAAFLALALLGAGAALTWRLLGARELAPQVDYVLLDGQRLNSRQWAGKVMLVNFWATSCATCVKEMPQIVATYESFKQRGVDTLAVAMSYDPPAYVARYAESRKLPFGVAIDNTGQIAQAFGQIQLTPTTLVINKHGEIVKRLVGEPDFTALHDLLERLIREG